MSDRETLTTRIIRAPAHVVYSAFVDPGVLIQWLPPAGQTGDLDDFSPGVGGGYRLRLSYEPTERSFVGRLAAMENRIAVRYLALEPPRRIVGTASYEADDPMLAGEMTVTVTLSPVPGGTEVTMQCANRPPGVGPWDSESGACLSLDQLARRFE